MSDSTKEPRDTRTDGNANRDPLTGEPGAHPVGTGVGATGGALAGAAVGAVAGPVGVAIGLVAGAIAGGLAGKQVAEQLDPTVEDAYWREQYSKASYADTSVPYEFWSPAYRLGYEGYQRHPSASFEDVEAKLGEEYGRLPEAKRLGWDKARLAARDAWLRIQSRARAFQEPR